MRECETRISLLSCMEGLAQVTPHAATTRTLWLTRSNGVMSCNVEIGTLELRLHEGPWAKDVHIPCIARGAARTLAMAPAMKREAAISSRPRRGTAATPMATGLEGGRMRQDGLAKALAAVTCSPASLLV